MKKIFSAYMNIISCVWTVLKAVVVTLFLLSVIFFAWVGVVSSFGRHG